MFQYFPNKHCILSHKGEKRQKKEEEFISIAMKTVIIKLIKSIALTLSEIILFSKKYI